MLYTPVFLCAHCINMNRTKSVLIRLLSLFVHYEIVSGYVCECLTSSCSIKNNISVSRWPVGHCLFFRTVNTLLHHTLKLHTHYVYRDFRFLGDK